MVDRPSATSWPKASSASAGVRQRLAEAPGRVQRHRLLRLGGAGQPVEVGGVRRLLGRGRGRLHITVEAAVARQHRAVAEHGQRCHVHPGRRRAGRGLRDHGPAAKVDQRQVELVGLVGARHRADDQVGRLAHALRIETQRLGATLAHALRDDAVQHLRGGGLLAGEAVDGGVEHQHLGLGAEEARAVVALAQQPVDGRLRRLLERHHLRLHHRLRCRHAAGQRQRRHHQGQEPSAAAGAAGHRHRHLHCSRR
ncbi:MAG: hypothetical protein DI563_16480 [Variovorax paradoxus]|uniref:Uncharacterized protein n=1 Tax=Variovorax paradoxus TaxID=34073 RepID=A0A2W5RY27_VARPD|nr:MAG: hypothetical protein DI563_16480 [Variovorax paradoxus]